MKKIALTLVLFSWLFLSFSSVATEPSPVDSVRQFTFNHSLWVHFPNPKTATPYWVGEFASANKTKYGWNGQFGHMNDTQLPPRSHLYSRNSENIWRSESRKFNKLKIDSVVLMPPNFAQWESAENEIRHAQRVVDYVAKEQPGMINYLYEHWPESEQHNLKGKKWDEYKNYTNGDYHQWYLDYQNGLIQSRPNLDIRMIPAGPIITDILNNPSLLASGLAWNDLYEDKDPHGTEELYFLAGLVSYQSMFAQKVSGRYKAPSSLNKMISDDFPALNDFVWQRLQHYKATGVRVWP